MDKEKPVDVPGWRDLLNGARPVEKDEMHSLRDAFRAKVFVGKVVTNWCQKCRKWRIQFVSLERLSKFIMDQKFPCTVCKGSIPLLVDDSHTVLSNVDGVLR